MCVYKYNTYIHIYKGMSHIQREIFIYVIQGVRQIHVHYIHSKGKGNMLRCKQNILQFEKR